MPSVSTLPAGRGIVVNDESGTAARVPGVVLIDPASGLPYAGGGGGGGGGGTSNTTEATQLLVKAAVQTIATRTPASPATAAGQDTTNAAIGAPADARAPWYDSAASLISLLKLSIAAFVGAGSRTYIYTNGALTSEQWTLFGTTRTKTYTYTSGALTAESDWV
ncbi:MAG: hypothetical protein PHI64_12670 [Zoogloea sp.]|uniref:hypothetical protein n=1 Tax=Zoogloea sp. TaxID=49181 RepID=UPI00262745AF|nr:hypothetical protein [Zoogloea sp.]MDD2989802.1 hypothetical protein [Zoogloea sp.]